jgi:hypothetical protein
MVWIVSLKCANVEYSHIKKYIPCASWGSVEKRERLWKGHWTHAVING